MKSLILLAALLLAACDSKTAATPATSATPPAVVTARFVATPPSAAKVASAQTNPWVDVVAFDEVGLHPGQTITYQVTGSATASYTCNGKSTTAAGPVSATKSLTANASGEINEVIAVQPPAPPAGMCTASYPSGIWGFSYQTLHLLDSTNRVSEDVPGLTGGA